MLSFHLQGKAEPKQETTIYRSIEEHNMKSFPPQEPNPWSTRSLSEAMKRFVSEQIELKPYGKRKVAFDMLNESAQQQKNFSRSTVLDATTWSDLSFFCGQSSLELYLGSRINRTQTELGKVALFKMLTEPEISHEKLMQRQKCVKEIIEDNDLFEKLKEKFSEMKESENILFSFWNNDMFKGWAEELCFKKPLIKKLNTSPLLLDITSKLGHARKLSILTACVAASTCLPVATGYELCNREMPHWLSVIADRYQGSGDEILSILSTAIKNNFKIERLKIDLSALNNKSVLSGLSLASSFLTGLAVPQVYDWEIGSYLLEKYMHFKICQVANYFKAFSEIKNLIENNSHLASSLPAYKKLELFFGDENQEVKELLSLLNTQTFESKHMPWTFIGRTIKAYHMMHEHKEKLLGALEALGEIDAHLSIAQLYKEFEGKDITFSFAKYAYSDTPLIELESFWNPFIDSDKVIPNSLILGNGNRNNALITGPNAGGKSTVIKAVALNLILAQTLGIVPAQNATITPFSHIATHLNIVDDIGAGNSLFKTEVIRAQNLIEKIENLTPGEFCFTAMDEVFNGTTPAEGEAAAYSIAHHASKFQNSVCMIATHFARLTKLEAQTDSFSNYKVSVTKNDDGTLSYPFKLERGSSNQHVAFDMLRLEGIDNEIVTQAQHLLE